MQYGRFGYPINHDSDISNLFFDLDDLNLYIKKVYQEDQTVEEQIIEEFAFPLNGASQATWY